MMRLILSVQLFLACSSASVLAQNSIVENRQATPPFDASERLEPPKLAFFVIGAWGCGGAKQSATANAMLKGFAEGNSAAVLTTGDNFLDGGVSAVDDPQWNAKYAEMFPFSDFPAPFYPVLGMADYSGDPGAQVKYSYKPPKTGAPPWRMPAKYWSEVFTAAEGTFSVRVTGLDTPSLVSGKPGERDAQLHWLDSVLVSAEEDWSIVVGHHPIYSNGRGGNTLSMMLHVKPLLEKRGVNAYVAGRDNDLQLLAPLRGVRYAVSAAFCRTSDTRWAGNTLFADARFGFIRMEMNKTDMLMQFIASDGSVMYSLRSPK